MTFEEANANYWSGNSDFKITVSSGNKHLCFDCSHYGDCIPGGMCSPVSVCNHFEKNTLPNFICEDVKDALTELRLKMEALDQSLPGVKESMKILTEVENNWKTEGLYL